ncbi:hypothetical protein [Sphingomonas sp. GC_Shp_3]|uniref:hypothetical protein n=1 Tax=Sphingomonas sp. GC_Shp_3 TaxID=2937383 RepID=UPI002269A653|nr:hypothetical protein [Sphingomonas sp. GC_Shp_3]
MSACRSSQAAIEAMKESDGAVDDAFAEHSRAIDRLIITPAPNQGAMLTKIEYLASAHGAFAIEATMLGALAADARRLLAEG